MRFDLVDLRLFVSVAATGSLTKAADSFPIAISAASARLKALEESLRVPLLERSSRGVALTPAGEVFLRRALAILKETTWLKEDLEQFDQGGRGTIHFQANTNAINEFLPTLLASFLSQNSHINVEMREGTTRDIVQAVESGAADLGIVASGIGVGALEVHPFRNDRLVLIAQEEHPLARHAKVRFHQTLDFEFISLGDSASLQIWLAKTAVLLGRTMRLRVQVGNFDAVGRLVEAGAGISIIPESSATRLQKTMRYKIIQLDEDWAQRNLKVVVRSLETLAPHVRKLFDHLVAVP